MVLENVNTYIIDRKFEGTAEWFLDLCKRINKASAVELNVEQKNLSSSVLWFPGNNGFVEFITLEKGLSLLKADCSTRNNIVINHLPNNEYGYSFFHFSITLDTTYIEVPDLGAVDFGESFSKAIFYSSANKSFKNIYPAHKKVKFINVFATKDWIEENIKKSININSSLATNILNDTPFQKMYNLNLQCYDLVNEIIHLPANTNYELLYLTGKVLILLSVFCETAENTIGRDELKFMEDSRAITRQIDTLLMDIITPWPDLDAIASRCGMSRTKFAAIFKKKYGKSYYAFYTDARLIKAYEAIVKQNMSISEAAWNIGFTNLGYFSKLFKQYFGILPSSLKS